MYLIVAVEPIGFLFVGQIEAQASMCQAEASFGLLQTYTFKMD